MVACIFSQCEKYSSVKIIDENFLEALVERGVDTDGDGSISFREAADVKTLDINYCDIFDLTGIEWFINLETLRCGDNDFTEIDVSRNTALKYLDIEHNKVLSLDDSHNINLEILITMYNPLTSLDISKNTALKSLVNQGTPMKNDGTEIPLVTSDTAWSNLRTPGYCWYGNYEAFFNLNHYGALYNYYAVTTGKLCPAGWHVPETGEWYTLISYLGENTAGGKMKETGTRNWLTPNTGATNESGFNALPGGFRNAYYKDFQRFRISGHFWHSNHSDVMRVTYSSEDVIHGTPSQNDGASVRCIKDQE